jgi:hypothetical protein
MWLDPGSLIYVSFLDPRARFYPRIFIPYLPFLFPPIFSFPLEHWTRVLELGSQRFDLQAPATTLFGFVSAIVSSISGYNQRTSHPLLQHEYRSGDKGIEGGLEDAEMSRFLCSGPFPSLLSGPHGIARCCCCASSGLATRLFHFWTQVGSSAVATFLIYFFLHSCRDDWGGG